MSSFIRKAGPNVFRFTFRHFAWCTFAIFFLAASVSAQQLLKSPAEPTAPSIGVPSSEIGGLRLLKFSGMLRGQPGQSLPPVVGVTIGVFKDEEGGSPLWTE